MKTSAQLLVLGLCICALPALARPVIEARTMQHLLAINDDGSPRSYDVRMPSGEVISHEAYNFSNHVESIISSIRSSGRSNILLYVLGGNSPVDGGAEKAGILCTAIWHTTDFYPIIISWESSMFDAYFDHLFWIRRGARSPVFGPLTMPLYLFTDFASAFARAPITLINHSYVTARGTFFTPLDIDENADEFERENIHAMTGADLSSPTVNVLRRIVYTCGFPFRLFTVPVIDAGGRSMWRVMCARTQTAFQKSHTLDLPRTEEFDVAYTPPDGALGVLLERLIATIGNDPKYAYTLIGYSFGAMIANYAVRDFPQLNYREIVFLGGATSLNDTGLCLGPYLKEHPNCKLYTVSLHQRADEREYMWLMLLPRGSILEWIDSFLSDPITLNDLSIGLWKNCIRTLPGITDEMRHQIVIKAYGIDDPEMNTTAVTKPQKHTDFGEIELEFWRPEFWRLPKFTGLGEGVTGEAVE
jgi:pimeloyl-ACP methyl ester carboxylesterase